MAVWRGAAFPGRRRRCSLAARDAIRRLVSRRSRRDVVVLRDVPEEPHRSALGAEEQVLLGIEYGDLGRAMSDSPEMRAVMRATVLDGLTTRRPRDCSAYRRTRSRPGCTAPRLSCASAWRRRTNMSAYHVASEGFTTGFAVRPARSCRCRSNSTWRAVLPARRTSPPWSPRPRWRQFRISSQCGPGFAARSSSRAPHRSSVCSHDGLPASGLRARCGRATSRPLCRTLLGPAVRRRGGGVPEPRRDPPLPAGGTTRPGIRRGPSPTVHEGCSQALGAEVTPFSPLRPSWSPEAQPCSLAPRLRSCSSGCWLPDRYRNLAHCREGYHQRSRTLSPGPPSLA